MNGTMSSGLVFLFYTVIVLVAFGLGWIADLDVLIWHDQVATSVVFDAVLGTVVGLVVVVVSQILDRTTRWARTLTDEFARILGPVTVTQAFIFAATSGIAEEMFFRGFLQQLLSVHVFGGEGAAIFGLVVASLIFGGLHVGSDRRRFWPWTAMATVLGGVFGWMYLYTGSILAPTIAHFTINFFNLLFMNPSTEVKRELPHEE